MQCQRTKGYLVPTLHTMSANEGVFHPKNVCNVRKQRGTSSPPKKNVCNVSTRNISSQKCVQCQRMKGYFQQKKSVQCQWVKGYLVPKMYAMSVHEGVSYPKNVCNVTTQQGYLVPKMCVMSTHEGVLNPYTSSQN